MKKILLSVTIIALTTMISCKDSKKDNEIDDSIEDTEQTENQNSEADDLTQGKIFELSIPLESKSDSESRGVARLIQKDGKVSLNAKLAGLSPGTHAIHIHEKADCSAADGSSAGGHWNPTFAQHGKWGDAEGYHKGDIGNFEINENGTGTVSFTTDEWCIGCGDDKKDIIGKSIIVHKGADDFTSQPSGDAGSRIACGGIIQ